VVGLSDRGVAVGRAADPGVARGDQPVEAVAELADPGVHAGEVSGDRVGEDPAQPAGGPGAEPLDRGPDQVPRPTGGDRAVAGDVRGLVVRAEHRLGGDHQVDVDRDDVRLGDAGDQLDEPVGHQLASGPGVTRRLLLVGVPSQARVDRDALGDREQGGQPTHGVRGGSRGDGAVPLGPAGPADGVHRVQPLCRAARGGDQPSVAETLQTGRVAADLTVDLGAVLGREGRGLAGQQLGAPLGQVAGLERGQGVRHLAHPGLRGAEPTTAAVRRLAAGQGDLRGDTAALPSRAHPGGGLRGPLRGVEVDRDPGLCRRGRGLQVLQLPQRLDPRGVVQVPTESGESLAERAHLGDR